MASASHGARATAEEPSAAAAGTPAEADFERRFGGLARLYGAAGAARIREASVAVVGIGGVGSWAAEALARSGVGRLVLVDMDHVAESNLNRQIHALGDTVGQAKIDAMADRIRRIHPDCEVVGVDDFVTEDNWPALLPCPVDGVIDACDAIRAKSRMAAWARAPEQRGFPFIVAGAAGGKTQAHLVDIADLASVTHDPLLAQVRYRLRKFHGAPKPAAGKAGRPIGIAGVYSREAVAAPVDAACGTASAAADGSLNCHGYGSVVSVTATFGMVAAGWMLNRLALRP
ncbi:MAG: tRNA threonylcarbamoyladenosine dehydratase [Xylophilus ampelinus]